MGVVGFEPTSPLRETGLQPAEPPTAQYTQNNKGSVCTFTYDQNAVEPYYNHPTRNRTEILASTVPCISRYTIER